MDKKVTLSVDIAPMVGYQASVNLVDHNGAGEGCRVYGSSYAGNSENLFETELGTKERATIRQYLDVIDGPGKEEQLRELLSYCKTEAENLDLDVMSDEFNPYDDVAYRLAGILDGEK